MKAQGDDDGSETEKTETPTTKKTVGEKRTPGEAVRRSPRAKGV